MVLLIPIEEKKVILENDIAANTKSIGENIE